MAAKSVFLPELRERFLTLLELGRTIESACADVGISRTTVNKWATRGRKEGASAEAAAFAERFDAIRDLGPYVGLSNEDLIRLLEKAARQGSVRATQLLLERPWERRKQRGDQDPLDQPKLDGAQA